MIHSGVWGFASSPIVTEDEIRRISRMAIEVARASAIARKTEVKLAPVPAYVVNWSTPMVEIPSKATALRRPMMTRRASTFRSRVITGVMADQCKVSTASWP